jgi:gas vesicle protein
MNNSGKNFIWFLTGLSAGALLGILFAPDEGRNTRDKLSSTLSRYKNKLLQLISELEQEEKKLPENTAKTEGQKVITEIKTQAEQLLNDVEGLRSMIEQTRKQNPK